MVNTSAIWQQAVHNTYLLSYPSCSTRATQNKKYISHRNILVNILEKKSRVSGPLAEQWQDKKGKRTRQREKKMSSGDRKWEPNEIPGIPDIRYPWPPFGMTRKKEAIIRSYQLPLMSGVNQNRHHTVSGQKEEQIRTDITWWLGRMRSRSEQTYYGDRAGRGEYQNRHIMVTGQEEGKIKTDITWWLGRMMSRSEQTYYGDRAGRGEDQNRHYGDRQEEGKIKTDITWW